MAFKEVNFIFLFLDKDRQFPFIRSCKITYDNTTGSYDHTVRMWDKRTGDCTLTLDHGSPVESLVVLPTGGIAISSG